MNIPNDFRRIVLAASLWFKNALSARLWFKEARKASDWVAQRKELATRERQSYGLNPAKLCFKSHDWPGDRGVRRTLGCDASHIRRATRGIN